MKNDTILTIPKAAKHCGLHRVTLWKYVKNGDIRTFKTPGGQFRIHIKDLESFMQSKRMYPFSDHWPSEKRILIVDDDPKIRKLISQSLGSKKFILEFASDGFEAGLKISKSQPQLVILDLFLPEMDGFKVCRQIKEDEDVADTKIIAISGYDTHQNRQKILDCGADLFMSKPLDFKNLTSEIEKLIN